MEPEQFDLYKDAIKNKLKFKLLHVLQNSNSLKLSGNGNENRNSSDTNSVSESESENESDTNISSSERMAINTFLNATRQLSNSYNNKPSNKLIKMAEMINSGAKPVLVYSNFKENGIFALDKILKEKYSLRTELFTGDLSIEKKNSIVEKYNNYHLNNNSDGEDDKIDVLLITSSGGEGIDLKNTRNVHIMEPHWNIFKINQVIGRAIRYKSHIALPENQRKVVVYKWISELPENKEALKY